MGSSVAFGAIAPQYVGLSNSGKLYSFESQAGNPAALVLVGALDAPGARDFVNAFDAQRAAFAAVAADLVAFATDSVDACFEYTLTRGCGLTIASDARQFIDACGVEPPAVLVIDVNRVVIGRYSGLSPEAAVNAALAHVSKLRREVPTVVKCQAPVLLLHNVIGPDFCVELIDLFGKGGHFDSGFMTIDQEGQPRLKIDHTFKRRQDHFIFPDHPMNGRLVDVMVNRIVPEVAKAFQVEIAHCERFLVSCYDETGFFRRHRDNVDPANAHRQFALTLNLNDGYDGGHLTFPEFGPYLYRPEPGDAVVFSASLLHEARPVTRGTRYAVLGFLYSVEADARRQQYLAAREARDAG